MGALAGLFLIRYYPKKSTGHANATDMRVAVPCLVIARSVCAMSRSFTQRTPGCLIASPPWYYE